jgi:hypothetical protein
MHIKPALQKLSPISTRRRLFAGAGFSHFIKADHLGSGARITLSAGRA